MLPELLYVLVNCPKAKAASVNDKAVYGEDSRWGTSDSLASRSHVRDRGSSSFQFPELCHRMSMRGESGTNTRIVDRLEHSYDELVLVAPARRQIGLRGDDLQ
jgi:hypothetical protein